MAQADSPAFVTGTLSCRPVGTPLRRIDEGIELLKIGARCTFTMSDPRVSGYMLSDIEEICAKDEGNEYCLISGTAELVPGLDGRWVGTWGSIYHPTLDAMPTWLTMEGTGEFEDWTYWVYAPNHWEESVASGIIYEGPPPPWGDSLPLVPAE